MKKTSVIKLALLLNSILNVQFCNCKTLGAVKIAYLIHKLNKRVHKNLNNCPH